MCRKYCEIVTKLCRNCSGLLDAYGVSLFFPSGQKCRLRGSDRLKEREEESSPSRRKAHESSPEVYPGEPTVLSSRMLSLPGLSETVTAGSEGVGEQAGDTRKKDQYEV